jgi:hypothetical protein
MKLATADDEENTAALIYRASFGPFAKTVGGTFWISAKNEKKCSVLKNVAEDSYVVNVTSCYSFGVANNAYCEFNS